MYFASHFKTAFIPVSLLAVAAVGQTTRLQPENLVYQGAFRLPANTTSDELKTWCYGGSALAFYPEGDPTGPGDGFPGSLYGVGHTYGLKISEISIPIPKPLAGNNVSALPVAKTLQGFQNVTNGVLPYGSEVRVAGLEYLPKQAGQAQGGLYFSMGHHWMNFDAAGENQPTHWHIELNLSQPKPAGPWKLQDENAFKTSGYIFEIDSAWAAVNTPGKRLAAGGFREAIGGSYGPSLYAYGPWGDQTVPAAGSALRNTTLFGYGNPPDSMVDNKHADFWTGGAWLAAAGKSAVVLMGSKGMGAQWYGEVGGGYKGWNAEPYAAAMIFFDPADLAKVVKGQMKPSQVQPYAFLNIDKLMLHPGGRNMGGTAYDRANGILYVAESDGTEPLVHVWKLQGGGGGGGSGIGEAIHYPGEGLSLLPAPGGSGIRVVTAGRPGQGPLVLDILDVRGGLLRSTETWFTDGKGSIDIAAREIPASGMFLRARYGNLERIGRLPSAR
jgi:hypothetical protein